MTFALFIFINLTIPLNFSKTISLLPILNKILFFLLVILSIIYSFNLIKSTFPNCFRSLFLNDGGLGVIPYTFILFPLILIVYKGIENSYFLNLAFLGIVSTYAIYPILNKNAWFCDTAGWGGSLPRAWIHFAPMMGIGVYHLVINILYKEDKNFR